MPTDSLVIKRHFKAPPERVFAAFTEKGLMQAWYGPEAMTVPHCEVDARVGGKYRVEMHSPAGSVHIVTGEFREIHPPERLVYTWGWLNGASRGPAGRISTFCAKAQCPDKNSQKPINETMRELTRPNQQCAAFQKSAGLYPPGLRRPTRY